MPEIAGSGRLGPEPERPSRIRPAATDGPVLPLPAPNGLSAEQRARIDGLSAEQRARIDGLSAEQRARFEEILRRKLAEDGTIQPASGPGPWPASLGQERMWIGSDLAPSVNTYATAVRLRGPVNLPALRASLLRVAQRHETLRTTFRLDGARLTQRIAPRASIPVRLVDLGGLPPTPDGALPEPLRRLIRAEARRPLDLGTGPLLRVTAYRLGPDDHCLMLSIHHTVTDGWSHGVLVAELAAGYQDLLAGRPWSAPPLPIQYRDYASWQRERLAGAELAALTRYWAETLRELPRLELPVDVNGTPGAGGANLVVRVDPRLRAGLEELRRAEGGSRFMLVLAALVVVLSAVTGASDLVVGTLATGRTRPELERLIGYFVNVLPLRFRLPDRPRFRQLWALVREQVQAGYAHQEMPYEKLLEQLRAEGVAGASTPIRVLCVPHLPPAPVRLAGVVAQVHDVDLGNAPFDLVVEVHDGPDELRMAFQYDTGLFTEPTVRLLGEHLRDVLAAAVADPDASCPDLLPAPPRRGPAGQQPGTAGLLHEAVEAQAAHRPDAVALVDGAEQVSYRALNARANQLARHLRTLGVRADDRVGICLPRSASSVTTMLAVLKAGGAYVALDPAHPPARHAEILADAGLRAVVTTGALLRARPDDSVPTIALDASAARLARCPDTDLRLPLHPDQAAYLVYTSGSTGRPKGVVGLHRGAVNRAEWMRRHHPVGAREVCALRSPLTFVDSVWETFGPLRAGARLVVLPDAGTFDPDLLVEQLAVARVSRIVVVPALLGVLLDSGPGLADRLPYLRTWITSGEEIRPDLADRFHRELPGARLLNLYGCSEVSADATAVEVPVPAPPKVPVGRPLSGVTAVVADGRGRAVPALVPGEILVGGAALARGYHGRPGRTAEVFRPDPYGPAGARVFHTGDLARQRATGDLEYLGRRDRQVQVRGHRVEPGEVEETLLRHPGVRAAAVVVRPDEGNSSTLVGYVVADADVAELRAFLGDRLPGYLVPSRLVPVDTLPRTASGKVDRLALPALRPAPRPAARPAANPAEQVIAAAFAEVLGLPTVGREDDFFLSGGHSVLATALVRLLSDRLGVRLRLADLFAAPSPAALAGTVDRLPRDRSAAPAVLVPDPQGWHEPFPLTDVQQAYYVGRGEDLRLGGVSTHAYLELMVADLDLDRFSTALRGVIARHPMLRAVMLPDGTQQVLSEVPPYRLTVYPLRGVAEPERARRLATVRDEMSHQLLGPHQWPLFDVRASLLPPVDGGPAGDRVLLHVSIDALICDAFSFGLVMDELAARYRDPALRPAELDVSFRDYVLHQVARRGSAEHAAALAYWRERLPALPTGPELPAGGPAGRPGPHRFTRRDGRLDVAAWTVLKQRATAAGLTPSGVLLAAFAEVLTAWSRRPHYSLVLTVFDREPVHPRVAEIVGDFTSLSVLEVDHTRPGPFLDRAVALQRRLWSDLDASAVSAVQVMREWALARGLSPQLSTPIVFTSNLPVAAGTADPAPGWARHGGLGELAYAITQTPQVQLDHQVSEEHGELLFNWDAVDELFAPDVLDQMFTAYRELLARLAGEPAAWSRPALPELPAAQAARRRTVNDTASPVPAWCLHEPVATVAAGHPDRVAVLDGTIRLSYAELAALARPVAEVVRRAGVRPNTLVGVATRRGWPQVVATLGVLTGGAAFLPLDPELPAERFALLARRGEITLLFTEADLLAALPALPGVRVVAVERPELPDSDEPADAAPAEPTDLAYVIFTSGSTGEPKGVAIDHRGAANTVDTVNRRYGIGPDDRILAVSSLSFDLAVYDLFGMFAAGGAVVLPEHGRRRDPAHWAELVRQRRITVWNSVPALAELLVGHAEAVDPDALTSLRLVLLSGDWIPVGLPDRIRALTGARVVSLGGATEASIWSVWYPVGAVRPDWRSIPYGMPMDNQTLHVLDDAGRDRPDWVAGELYIGGLGVARGYWRDDELTRRSFPVHPATGRRLYRTGDIARYLPDGNLEFLGREDAQVKINGFRVELGEIEAALDRTGLVRAAAVTAVGRPGGDRRLAAHLVPADPRRFDLDHVRVRLRAVLPDYMVPTTWTVLDELPLTGNGKVDQRALSRRTERAEGLEKTGSGGPPSGRGAGSAELTERLCALWRETLDVESVGPDDSFFALGGTSLVAIRMLTRLEQSFGVRIPLPQLFDSPTVAALAEAISAASRSTEPVAGPAVALRPEPDAAYEPFPLTDIQQAYWLGRRAGAGLTGVATHSYLELEVADLDLPRLEQALRRLVDAHPALRTVIRPDGRQQVLPTVPAYRIPVTDLRGLDPERAGAARQRLRDRMSHEVRDVAHWPLFDLRAQRLDGGQTRLHLSFDLLTVDARSMWLLTREVLARYADPAAEPSGPDVTFRDYVLAVQRLRETEPYRQALHYWRDRLADLPPAPALPLARRPEELRGAAFHRLAAELDEPAWRALRNWAAATDLTPSGLLCAAFCRSIAGWSESPRFTVNLTTFQRLPVHPDVDSLVGDFTTTTLLAVECTGGPFPDEARRVQERIWQDLEHGIVSGVEVQRMLRRVRGGGADVIMPVVFTSTLFPEPAEPLPAGGWEARPVYAISQTPQVLLDHQVGERAGRLVFSWDYVPSAFPPGLVETMFAAYRRLLRVLAQEAAAPAPAVLAVDFALGADSVSGVGSGPGAGSALGAGSVSGVGSGPGSLAEGPTRSRQAGVPASTGDPPVDRTARQTTSTREPGGVPR
ncbi:non-ribosomal peptide synthetase [Plantactinospora sp. KLBMP9567]|uniref:non-ribosomal peptide synthetase n=1 Tax=Plantactinospora sp. KLBMP9567 TaxID=3085900 RepID=UPI00298193E4|nr:non-ribosomal peptide synthetase [Plantactinospora sp. KLBMP9567]MDW5324853.1 amino acid adenylation domain-containing protein [Plantactinospora sp. KLBMP9567]